MMDATFNPYLKWLGIPLKDQPPTHYRLLGVEVFESDPDIIERAADRQMVYLRSLHGGEHAKLAEALLNEIARAKVCLLCPERKAQYDQQLRATPRRRPTAPLKQAVLMDGELPPFQSEVVLPANTAASAGLSTASAAVAAGPRRSGSAQVHSAMSRQLFLVLMGAGATAAIGLLMLGGAFIFLRGASRENSLAENSHVEAIDSPHPSDQGGSDIVTHDVENAASASSTPANPDNEAIAADNSVASNVGASRTELPSAERPPLPPPPPPPTIEKKEYAYAVVAGPTFIGILQSGVMLVQSRAERAVKVDARLERLQFARAYLPQTRSLQFGQTRPGLMYLALAPDEARRAAEAFEAEGWKLTDIELSVSGADGSLVNWGVFEVPAESRNIKLSWSDTGTPPVFIAERILRPTRPLTDVASIGPPIQVASSIPPNGPSPAPDNGGLLVPSSGDVVKKTPVPSRDAQQPVREQLATLFELAKLQEPQEKRSAAAKILASARSSTGDPTERYVMLATGAQLAADGGDLRSALQSVDIIEESFNGDASAMRLYLASLFVKAKAPTALKGQQLVLIVPVMDEGLRCDHYDEVESLVRELLAAGLRHAELGARRKAAVELREKYRRMTAAKSKLEQDPADGPANSVVGEFLALYKLKWSDALPYLAKGGDASMAAAAKLDLADPDAASDQLAVANSWFELGQLRDAEPQEQGAMLARAQTYYSQAIGELKGLDQAQARKRL
ncbi:MAG: hypothetical protein KDA41_12050, partial [Planctomycetales bacterium]|nr:hypothetical protein [Planctomycetales bacterium]